jgi:stress response protein YsnF
MSLPEEDRHLYAEGMRRGYATVCVRVDEARAPAVEETLDRHGALDFDEREASWRSEGWQGHAAAEGGTTTTATLASATGATAAGLGAARVRDDGVVERAEERLVVGKRQAAGGRVRVRSYVVETPFEEQVTLQQERVHVERRPVDRPVRPGDAVFQERVIEASERPRRPWSPRRRGWSRRSACARRPTPAPRRSATPCAARRSRSRTTVRRRRGAGRPRRRPRRSRRP